jgi:hypothetical protein
MTQCRLAVCHWRFGGTCSHVIVEEIEGGRLMPLRNVGNVLPVNTASFTARFLSSSSSLLIYIVLFLKKATKNNTLTTYMRFCVHFEQEMGQIIFRNKVAEKNGKHLVPYTQISRDF